MEGSDIPSLSAQLLSLQSQHRSLDEEITQLQSYAYIDQLQLQRLKKQKLRLKQNIERLKDLLIPDLDA